MKKNKIVVTGGAGYIGSLLVKKLQALGYEIVVIDNLSTGRKQNLPEGISFYEESLESNKIFSILEKEKPTIIFHLASKKSIEDSLRNPLEFASSNILGSLNVLQAASTLGIKKFIFTSTAAVYGESFTNTVQKESQLPSPVSPYGAGKLAIEGFIHYYNKFHGMEGIVLRFANVYGKGGETNAKGVVDIFLEKIANKTQVIVHGNGNQVRDFVYIQDIIDMCILLASTNYAEKTKGHHIFNIATGKGVSINELLELIRKITNINPSIVYEKNHFSGQMKSILSPNYTKETLGWVAKVPLEKGVAISFQEYLRVEKGNV